MSEQDKSRTSGSENYSGASSYGNSGSGMQDAGVRAQQKTGELIDQATDKVGEVAGKVKEQASSQISNQKEKAADSLGNVAEAIRQTGDQLRQKEQVAPVAQYTDQIAQGVETVSNYLKSKSLSDIVSEVERFARREPALFLGGALTVGLLAGRFLRSSSASSKGSSTTDLARTYNSSTDTGTYGSKGTGYSTALASDVEPGYSSLDMPDLDNLTGSYGRGSDEYSGLITSEPATGTSDLMDYPTSGYGSDSSTSGYGSSSSTGGYSSSYPADDFPDSNQSYGSQGRTGGNQGGGPLGSA